jgi:hypothetical protein
VLPIRSLEKLGERPSRLDELTATIRIVLVILSHRHVDDRYAFLFGGLALNQAFCCIRGKLVYIRKFSR